MKLTSGRFAAAACCAAGAAALLLIKYYRSCGSAEQVYERVKWRLEVCNGRHAVGATGQRVDA